MGKAPAFQIYGLDFDMDTATWENDEIGAYLRLLFYQWFNGGLPNDTYKLSKIVRESEKKFKKKWEIISTKFIQNGNGLLVNKKLEEIRQNQSKYSESRRKNVSVRYKDKATHEPTYVEDMKPVCNLSSSSSSSSINKKNKDIIPKLIFGEFQNVKLTEEEKKKLINSFGESGTKDRIENLSQYIASKGKKYSSHYATILSWERKNKPKEIPKPKDEYSYVGGKYGTPD